MPRHARGPASDDYDEYQRSRTGSTSPDSDSLWANEEDLLTVPEWDADRERVADPMFPSPHKFNLMVLDYLRNLSPKKREKALLTQKMYDAVLAVLRDPKDTSTKTAQFRFWAKKMFNLTQYGVDVVICHDLKPVAVKEQIYEVLCHCHGQAGHGGRDKTSAQVGLADVMESRLELMSSGPPVLLMDTERNHRSLRPRLPLLRVSTDSILFLLRQHVRVSSIPHVRRTLPLSAFR